MFIRGGEIDTINADEGNVLQTLRGKTQKNESRQYLRKMIYTYSLVIYATVIITALVFFIYIQYNRIQKAEESYNALFEEYVEKYEQVYEDFFAAAGNLKEMNCLDLFALSGEDSYYQKMTQLQQKLREFAVPYRRNGFAFAVKREDEELVVTDTNSTKLRYLLRDWGLTEQQYEKAVHLLAYTDAKDSIIFTDKNIFYITAKNYLNEKVYLLLYIPFSMVDVPSYNEDIEVYFWSRDDKVQDLRHQELPEGIMDESSSLTRGIMKKYTENHLEYRLQMSQYFDVVYCGVVRRNYMEMVLGIALALLCALVPIYGIVYFVTQQISQKVYQPIEELTHVVFEASETADNTSENEIVRIANKVRSMKSQNEELKRRLDAISEDFQKTAVEKGQGKGKGKAAHPPDDLRERLEEYILQHLSEDISLYDVAEHFGLSFHYMSVVFKNKMDNNFKEYLSYQRYVRALELMQENPKIKISEVAAQIGISNVNTFIRIFKKYSGTTPKQYVNMLKTETNET